MIYDISLVVSLWIIVEISYNLKDKNKHLKVKREIVIVNL